jgi:hypothetical protein
MAAAALSTVVYSWETAEVGRKLEDCRGLVVAVESTTEKLAVSGD